MAVAFWYALEITKLPFLDLEKLKSACNKIRSHDLKYG